MHGIYHDENDKQINDGKVYKKFIDVEVSPDAFEASSCNYEYCLTITMPETTMSKPVIRVSVAIRVRISVSVSVSTQVSRFRSHYGEEDSQQQD